MTAITEFLRQQKEAGSPRRRAQRQKEWLDAVEDLFRQIRSWLAEAQREKLIKIHQDKIKIIEEPIGTYTAPSLILATAGKTVKVKPIGTTIVGADGRVDMESANGTYLFLYLADQHKWVHGVGKRPAEFPELTEDLFADLLKRAFA
jgi:hypothetical protein